MARYLLRRILGFLPLFFGITVITFFVIHLAPGKPTDLDTSLNQKVSYEARQRIEKLYGLDRPVHVQYALWLGALLKFDFGTSFIDGRSVAGKILESLPITLAINILSIVLILTVGIPLGILASLKRGTVLDRLTTILVFIGFSMPGFWLSLLLMNYIGIGIRLFPVSGLTSVDFDSMTAAGKCLDVVRHLVCPVFVSAFGGLAGISRYTRTSMISVIHQEYITAARAKGLSENAVIYKHALRNALLPIITILGLSIPGLIGGSVIFESVFAIPGMGRLFYDAVMSRDYPVIMGILNIGAILTLLGNFIADIAYSIADPRIRIAQEKR